MSHYVVNTLGFIRSTLNKLEAAPMQGDEGAPEAWLELRPEVAQRLSGVNVGDNIIVLTWLHLAKQDVLQVYPRDNLQLSHPIGLHPVTVLEIDGLKLRVAPLEAIDGTPIIDMKPVLKVI
jgi:tRNA (Thr-GGU) A37 N-methylase